MQMWFYIEVLYIEAERETVPSHESKDSEQHVYYNIWIIWTSVYNHIWNKAKSIAQRITPKHYNIVYFKHN